MRPNESAWHRPLWGAVLIAVSMALTTAFACITPLVAIAVMAALAAPRRTAIGLAIAAWVANQAVGFGVLHYPWTGNSIAWGIVLGGATVAAALTAQWVLGRLSAVGSAMQVLAAFLPAFAVYELGLYAVALAWLGGTQDFAPAIVTQVLIVNTVALLGLYGFDQIVSVIVRLMARRAARVSPGRRFA
jgi:hypothetical protein